MRLRRRKQRELTDNEQRQMRASNVIWSLDVQMVDVTGHRLPDGRTEVRVEVVGFTAPEPWLRQHFQDHPGMGDAAHD